MRGDILRLGNSWIRMLLIRVVPIAMVRFDKKFEEDLLKHDRDMSQTLLRETNRNSARIEEFLKKVFILVFISQ